MGIRLFVQFASNGAQAITLGGIVGGFGRNYGIACSQIDIDNTETPMASQMKKGVLQAHFVYQGRACF